MTALLPFSTWMRQVDQLTSLRYGVSIHDLEDLPFADCHQSGVTPSEFVDEEVAEAIEENYGDVF